ncbi:putative deoxyribonuclease TATDN1 [Hordeum vulgare]|nr:putative deoxyribonuclease TATDN1 [Hordeum vulgare]
MPSRRERATPPPVRSKMDQVFIPANTHHHRTPHPGDHAVHMAMGTGQHLATGSAHEHRSTTIKAAAPTTQTWIPPHPRPTSTPTTGTSKKDPPFTPLGGSRHGAIDPSCCRARDKLVVLPGT